MNKKNILFVVFSFFLWIVAFVLLFFYINTTKIDNLAVDLYEDVVVDEEDFIPYRNIFYETSDGLLTQTYYIEYNMTSDLATDAMSTLVPVIIDENNEVSNIFSFYVLDNLFYCGEDEYYEFKVINLDCSSGKYYMLGTYAASIGISSYNGDACIIVDGESVFKTYESFDDFWDTFFSFGYAEDYVVSEFGMEGFEDFVYDSFSIAEEKYPYYSVFFSGIDYDFSLESSIASFSTFDEYIGYYNDEEFICCGRVSDGRYIAYCE